MMGLVGPCAGTWSEESGFLFRTTRYVCMGGSFGEGRAALVEKGRVFNTQV